MLEQYGFLISLGLSFAPAFSWLLLIYFLRKREKKRYLFYTFLLGGLSVILVFGLQSFWLMDPDYNINTLLEITFTSTATIFLLFFAFMGAIEEVIKHVIVRFMDKKFFLIQTINIAIIFSITTALGFAFVENFIYFYGLLSEGLIEGFWGTFIFRTMFSTLGHVLFSAIFGYYYGVSKFSETILMQEKILGKTLRLTKIIERLTKGTLQDIYREQKIMKGLIFACGAHMLFNFFIQWQQLWVVFLILIALTGYVIFLFRTKTGHLVFMETKARSPYYLAPSNQRMLGHLLDMWHAGRYDEVEKICNDILLIDPMNDVVKLFRAQALDRQAIKKGTQAVTEIFKRDKKEEPEEEETVEEKLSDVIKK